MKRGHYRVTAQHYDGRLFFNDGDVWSREGVADPDEGIYKHEPGYREILSLGDLYEKDCDKMPIDEIVRYWNEACQIAEPRTAGERQDDIARDRVERRERYEAAEDLANADRAAHREQYEAGEAEELARAGSPAPSGVSSRAAPRAEKTGSRRTVAREKRRRRGNESKEKMHKVKDKGGKSSRQSS